MKCWLTDQDFVGSAVHTNPSVLYPDTRVRKLMFEIGSKIMILTAISQNGATTISDKSESSRETSGGGSAGKASDGSNRKLHFQ